MRTAAGLIAAAAALSSRGARALVPQGVGGLSNERGYTPTPLVPMGVATMSTSTTSTRPYVEPPPLDPAIRAAVSELDVDENELVDSLAARMPPSLDPVAAAERLRARARRLEAAGRVDAAALSAALGLERDADFHDYMMAQAHELVAALGPIAPRAPRAAADN